MAAETVADVHITQVSSRSNHTVVNYSPANISAAEHHSDSWTFNHIPLRTTETIQLFKHQPFRVQHQADGERGLFTVLELITAVCHVLHTAVWI